jgi:hypothetical protein
LALAVVALVAGPVLADDIVPPWWRYKDTNHLVNRSTLQQWEFGDDATFPVAEAGYTIPDGGLPPTASIAPVATWIDDDPDSARQGIWALDDSTTSGLIDLFISNYSDGIRKKVWIQLTWKPQTHIPAPLEEGVPLITVTPDFTTPVNTSLLTQISLAGDWIHSTYLCILEPNPQDELITISGDILVDEIVVDTICPEPATLALMGLGFPFLIKLRRRGASRN